MNVAKKQVAWLWTQVISLIHKGTTTIFNQWNVYNSVKTFVLFSQFCFHLENEVKPHTEKLCMPKDSWCITYLFGFFFVCRGRKSKWEFHVHSGKTGLWMGVMVKKLCWESEQLNTKWLYILTPADPGHNWDPCVTYLGWIPLPSHCLSSQC